jgi:hypothetical protein
LGNGSGGVPFGGVVKSKRISISLRRGSIVGGQARRASLTESS